MLQLLIMAAVLFPCHFFLLEHIIPQVYSAGAWWSIYLFLFPLTALTILGVARRYKKDHAAAGKTYFLFVFLKLTGSIGFLMPWLFPKTEFSTPFAHQFLILFFILLFVEVRLLIVLLDPRFGENLKNDENQ